MTTDPLQIEAEPSPDEEVEHCHVHLMRGPRRLRALWYRLSSRNLRLGLRWLGLRLFDVVGPASDPNLDPHDHVTLDSFEGPVQIDVRIVPVVRQLWRAGIETYGSCEGDAYLSRAVTWNMALRQAYQARVCVGPQDCTRVAMWIDALLAEAGIQEVPRMENTSMSEFWHVWFPPELLVWIAETDPILDAMVIPPRE